MAMTINTNIVSINAQRNLGLSGNSLSTTMQRLSSGLRVNSAKDDAAGLAIAERMNAQAKGLAVAARNANDGISLAQTSEGALGKVGDMLQRMRELSVQASNATNSKSDREALQSELSQLRSEIDRVAKTTSFNGQKILDGSFVGGVFQVGAAAGDNITIKGTTKATADSLGNVKFGSTESATLDASKVKDYDKAMTGLSIQVGDKTVALTDLKAASSGSERLGQMVAAINEKTSDTGVTAFLKQGTVPGNYSIELKSDSTSAVQLKGFDSLSAAVIPAAKTAFETSLEALDTMVGAFVGAATTVEDTAALLEELQVQLQTAAGYTAGVTHSSLTAAQEEELGDGTTWTATEAGAFKTLLGGLDASITSSTRYTSAKVTLTGGQVDLSAAIAAFNGTGPSDSTAAGAVKDAIAALAAVVDDTDGDATTLTGIATAIDNIINGTYSAADVKSAFANIDADFLSGLSLPAGSTVDANDFTALKDALIKSDGTGLLEKFSDSALTSYADAVKIQEALVELGEAEIAPNSTAAALNTAINGLDAKINNDGDAWVETNPGDAAAAFAAAFEAITSNTAVMAHLTRSTDGLDEELQATLTGFAAAASTPADAKAIIEDLEALLVDADGYNGAEADPTAGSKAALIATAIEGLSALMNDDRSDFEGTNTAVDFKDALDDLVKVNDWAPTPDTAKYTFSEAEQTAMPAVLKLTKDSSVEDINAALETLNTARAAADKSEFAELADDATPEAIEAALKKIHAEIDPLGLNVAGTEVQEQRGIDSIDITTQAGAWSAIKQIDSAIDQVNSARADLGALQTRFEKAIENIDIQSENINAARGRIVDADFAVETAALSRSQILQQAGTAMVAQANQLPQNVLSLLR